MDEPASRRFLFFSQLDFVRAQQESMSKLFFFNSHHFAKVVQVAVNLLYEVSTPSIREYGWSGQPLQSTQRPSSSSHSSGILVWQTLNFFCNFLLHTRMSYAYCQRSCMLQNPLATELADITLCEM